MIVEPPVDSIEGFAIPYEHERILKDMLGERHEKMGNYILRVYKRASEMLEAAGMPMLNERDMLLIAILSSVFFKKADKNKGRVAKRIEWENKYGFLKRGEKIFVKKGVIWYPSVFEEWDEGRGTMMVRINGIKRERARCTRVKPVGAGVQYVEHR